MRLEPSETEAVLFFFFFFFTRFSLGKSIASHVLSIISYLRHHNIGRSPMPKMPAQGLATDIRPLLARISGLELEGLARNRKIREQLLQLDETSPKQEIMMRSHAARLAGTVTRFAAVGRLSRSPASSLLPFQILAHDLKEL